jgi:toxin FitB
VSIRIQRLPLYLIDTNVISEARKGRASNAGVREFFKQLSQSGELAYLSTITVGELRRGVELIRYRGDSAQALILEAWLTSILAEFRNHVLDFDGDAAQVWGRLQVPHPEHAIDKQIAAIALVNNLTVVTRNKEDFTSSGVRLINPFSS